MTHPIHNGSVSRKVWGKRGLRERGVVALGVVPIMLWALAKFLSLSGLSFLLCLPGRWEEILETGKNSGNSSQLPVPGATRVNSLLRLSLGDQGPWWCHSH